MRLDKFTIKSQEAIDAARELAVQHGQQQIEKEHLLLALLRQEDGITRPLLQKLEVRLDEFERRVLALVENMPKVSGAGMDSYLSQTLKKCLDTAQGEAAQMKDDFISAEHLLMGIAAEESGALPSLLREFHITSDTILAALASVRGGQRVTDQNPEDKYQALERYCRDLTDLARRG